MDIRNELLKGHSRAIINRLVRFVGHDKKHFAELVDVFLAGPYRVTQRAAWPLTIISEQHPEMVKPHLTKILRVLDQSGIHDAVKRNVMRLLQFVEIPLKNHDDVAKHCFAYLNDKKEPVAIRVFAMSVLAKMTIHYPEFKNELKVLIEDDMPYSTAAFRSRGAKILKKLSEQ
jgi:hypothetical protein